LKRDSSNEIRQDLVNMAISDIRNTLPGRQMNIGNFNSNNMDRLLKLIDRRCGELMLKFVERKFPISIPSIGVIRIHKMRLTYMELERELLEQFEVKAYDDMSEYEKVEYDAILAKQAREYKIRYSKRYQRQFLEKANETFTNNICNK
jgi:hypothetical protein